MSARPSHGLPLRAASSYGLLGAGVSFAALPLYVHWPAFAEKAMGLSLTTLGGLLLAMRCLDAAVDPWLGRAVDHVLARARATSLLAMGGAAALLALGFGALFAAPTMASLPMQAPVAWALGALGLTYLGYSFVQIAHQAWGARLGGDAGYRAKVAGAREFFALAGVLAASVVPFTLGWAATCALLVVLLLVGMAGLAFAPRAVVDTPREVVATPREVVATPREVVAMPREVVDTSREVVYAPPSSSHKRSSLFDPLRDGDFRMLLVVHVLAGVAAAIPATLVLFFIRDRLGLPGYEGLFLLAYFAAAAVSLSAWTRLVDRIGLVRVWAAGMVLAIAAFVFAATLASGAVIGFGLVCLGTGIALGAQLVAPPALLAGVIQRHGAGQRDEGLWFGWWNLCSKLELALAAGVALPLVEWFGYRSGQRDEASLVALAWVYALVPCALEAAALVLLWRHRWGEQAARTGSSSPSR